MCTVSYIPRQNTAILTSNRDEHLSRPRALFPFTEYINGKKLLYPRDPIAGGTWFALDDSNKTGVLLNGAFKKHSKKGPYRKSRGLVLLDFMRQEAPLEYGEKAVLRNIEPFTIVILQGRELAEFRWDGNRRYLKLLNPKLPYIWSSPTLYTPDVALNRKRLFKQFLDSTESIGSEAVFNFHKNNHNDTQNGFVIERENGLKTFSITQVVRDVTGSSMEHLDLIEGNKRKISLNTNHFADLR